MISTRIRQPGATLGIVIFMAVVMAVAAPGLLFAATGGEAAPPDQPWQGRIPLRVESAGGVARAGWALTQGVPFAKGHLRVDQPVRVVTADGRALPTQATCLATWSPQGAFVRWLLVDFQADVPADGTHDFVLETGPEAEPPPPARPVVLEAFDDGAAIGLSTGALRLEIRRDRADFLSRCAVRDGEVLRDLFADGARPYLYMVDQDGTPYRSSWSKTPPTVEVEDRGPLRTSVCIRGVHAAEDGRPFCRYQLRIHVFAGKRDLRLFHTFVFDQDPDTVMLREVGLRWPLAPGASPRAAFGGHDGAHHVEGSGTLLQASDDACTLNDAEGRELARDASHRGWASLGGDRGAAVVVMRDMHLEYPKALAVDPAGIDMVFWPAAPVEPMGFHTPFREKAIWFQNTRSEAKFKELCEARPTAPLNLKSMPANSEDDVIWIEQMARKHAPGRAASHADTGTSNGFGAAKTHEVYLRLAPGPVADEESEALGLCVQEPLIAPADPAYMASTGALRHAYHSGDPTFADVDRGLDDVLEKIVAEPRRICRRYGMWMYGSLVVSHSINCGFSYRYHKERDPLTFNAFVGPYNNETNDMVWCVWHNFLHTGARAQFLLVEPISEHVADVAFCHAGAAAGLMHYHNAHLWSGDFSPSHTLINGLLLHHYFTGNRRLLEVALSAADWAVRSQEPAGIIRNRGSALHREFSGPLLSLLAAYQATWDPKYGDLARRSLNWLLRTQPEPGLIPMSVYTRGERGDEAHVQPADQPGQHAMAMYPLFHDALELFDSQLLRRTIVAEADAWVRRGRVHMYYTRQSLAAQIPDLDDVLAFKILDDWYWVNWPEPDVQNAPVLCLAYDLTGDPIYAACAKYLLEHYFVDRAERVRHLASIYFSYTRFGQPIPALMSTVRKALDADPEALRQAEIRWREERAASGNPVFDGPHDWLPRDAAHFDAGGFIIGGEPVKGIQRAPNAWRSNQPERSLGILSTDDHAP